MIEEMNLMRRAEQMFGENELISGEWTDGIFSKTWMDKNGQRKPVSRIICDGPVDAAWIENLTPCWTTASS